VVEKARIKPEEYLPYLPSELKKPRILIWINKTFGSIQNFIKLISEGKK